MSAARFFEKTSVQPTRGKVFIIKVAFVPRGETLDVTNLEARGPLTPLAPAKEFNHLRQQLNNIAAKSRASRRYKIGEVSPNG